MLTRTTHPPAAASSRALVAVSLLGIAACGPPASYDYPRRPVHWQPLPTAGQANPEAAAASPNAAAAHLPPARVIPTGDEVLIRDNAWLYAPHNLAIRFRYKAVTAPLAAHEVHRFEVMQDRGEWLIVAVGKDAGSPSRACVRPLTGLGHNVTGLRFAVRRTALAPVTTRHVKMRFDDDTDIHVPLGVPVGHKRGSDGWYALHGRAQSLYVPFAQDAVGWSYHGWGAKRANPPRLDKRITSGARFSYAHSEPLPNDALYNAYQLAPASTGPDADHTRIVEVRTACYRGHFRLSAHFLEDHQTDGGKGNLLGAFGGMAAGPWYKVAANSPVLWSDGVKAATLKRGFFGSGLKRAGENYCQERRIGSYGPVAERTLRVCYPAKHVSPRKTNPFDLSKVLNDTTASKPVKPTSTP